MHILTAILLRCYARLGGCHCDVTGHLACPQRPYSVLAAMLRQPVSVATSLRLFWACSKLGSDLGNLGDLTVICRAATALYEISQRPSGDQRRSGWFCRSQRGRRPVWLGNNSVRLCRGSPVIRGQQQVRQVKKDWLSPQEMWEAVTKMATMSVVTTRQSSEQPFSLMNTSSSLMIYVAEHILQQYYWQCFMDIQLKQYQFSCFLFSKRFTIAECPLTDL